MFNLSQFDQLADLLGTLYLIRSEIRQSGY
jgi:hypothetical protein